MLTIARNRLGAGDVPGPVLGRQPQAATLGDQVRTGGSQSFSASPVVRALAEI